MKLMMQYGGAGTFSLPSKFRVHSTSTLNREILRPSVENQPGRSIMAQLIGNDIPAIVRMVKALKKYPATGIDLNLGCPAPVVYCKYAWGGSLLRVANIIGALRGKIAINFSVKTWI